MYQQSENTWSPAGAILLKTYGQNSYMYHQIVKRVFHGIPWYSLLKMTKLIALCSHVFFLILRFQVMSVLNGSFSFWFVSCPQGLAAPAVLEGTPESDQEKRRWDFTPITYDQAKSGTASKYIGKGCSLQFKKITNLIERILWSDWLKRRKYFNYLFLKFPKELCPGREFSFYTWA